MNARALSTACAFATCLPVFWLHGAELPGHRTEVPGATYGKLAVPEDRLATDGRVLDLDYVVIPAQLEEQAPPLFFLLGGPGESATSIAPFVLSSPLADVLNNRSLVLLDQRGTGGTNRLQCKPPTEPERHFGHLYATDDVRSCRDELRKQADLGLYTTTIAVEDLDDLRRHLGYDLVALWGGSYGTRVAAEYIRRHGEHVERAVLDAVSGVDGRMPLFFAIDAQRAFDRMAADCRAEPKCRAAFPDLGDDLASALDRLRDGPVPVTIRVGADRHPVEVPFSLGDLGYAIRGMLYDPRQTARLPQRLDLAAAEGEFAPFAQAYYDRSAKLGAALANGLYLSVVCAEDVPFISDDDATRWSAGTFLGEYLIHEYRRACEQWVRGEIPPDFHEPVRSDMPVLVLSGGRDPSTPPRWGDRLVRGLPNGRHVVFPYGGHGVGDTACGAALVRAFLNGADPMELDVSCAADEGADIRFEIPDRGNGVDAGLTVR